jgi:hypothetical protein
MNLCKCGCGQEIPIKNIYGHPRKFIIGHQNKISQPKRRQNYNPNEYRICTGCNKELLMSEFRIRFVKTSSDQIVYKKPRSRCKNCDQIYNEKRNKTEEHKKWRKDYKDKTKYSIRGWVQTRLASWRAKDLQCDLTSDYLVELYNKQNGLCYYTNEEMIFPKKKLDFDGISLDKLNPEIGYKKGNVVFCKYKINTMKSNNSEIEFYNIMLKILKNRNVELD